MPVCSCTSSVWWLRNVGGWGGAKVPPQFEPSVIIDGVLLSLFWWPLRSAFIYSFSNRKEFFSSQDIQVQVKSQVTDVKVQVKFQVSLIFVQIHQMYHSSQSHVSRVKTSRLLSCHCRHWPWFQLGEICLDEETSCGHFQLCSVDRYMAPPSSVLILFFLGCYTPPVGVNKSKNQPVWPCR